jgi:hypothetical protein
VAQKVYVTLGPFGVTKALLPLPSAPVALINGWLVIDDDFVQFQSASTDDPSIMNPPRPDLRLAFTDNTLQMEQKMIQVLIWAFARAAQPQVITEDQMEFITFNNPTE